MTPESAKAHSPVERDDPGDEPVTEYDSKMVMLRGERHDRITIENTVQSLTSGADVPEELSIIQRNNTYYGPKLKLSTGGQDYLLTAPGPDAHLLLWESVTDRNGFRKSWRKIAEVTAQIADDVPQYDLCPYCGEPLKSLDHERKAAVGQCDGMSD